jgi:hypothetical protein
MKVLILGDSHCRDMDKLANTKATTPPLTIHVISVGGNTDAIMAKYRDDLAKVLTFGPDFIVMHTGNNELAFHTSKNPSPKDSTETTLVTLQAADILHANHPQAVIVLSAAFPRILSRYSPFTFEDLLHYNGTVKRHSNRLRSEATNHHYQAFLNNLLWKDKNNLIVKTQYYMSDGLHLTNKAKTIVVNDWISRLKALRDST